MKNEIQIFCHEQFGQIRTMELPDGQVGFVGKDVAEVLGYSNPTKAIQVHVDDEDKMKMMIEATSQNGMLVKSYTNIINESGLYALILSSKLPKAREFKHWVTAEVLPQIRKTGGYIPVQEEDDDKIILAKAVQILQRTVEQKDSLIAECKTVIGRQSAEIQQQTLMLVEQSMQIEEKSEMVKEQHHLIEEQNIILEEQQPLVEFAQTVGESQDTCTIAQLAKEICNMGVDMGQNRLFQWLREHKYLGVSKHHRNVPYQYWVEKGYFVVKTSNAWYDEEGKAHYNMTTLVTGKGQQYFINKFRTL